MWHPLNLHWQREESLLTPIRTGINRKGVCFISSPRYQDKACTSSPCRNTSCEFPLDYQQPVVNQPIACWEQHCVLQLCISNPHSLSSVFPSSPTLNKLSSFLLPTLPIKPQLWTVSSRLSQTLNNICLSNPHSDHSLPFYSIFWTMSTFLTQTVLLFCPTLWTVSVLSPTPCSQMFTRSLFFLAQSKTHHM